MHMLSWAPGAQLYTKNTRDAYNVTWTPNLTAGDWEITIAGLKVCAAHTAAMAAKVWAAVASAKYVTWLAANLYGVWLL